MWRRVYLGESRSNENHEDVVEKKERENESDSLVCADAVIGKSVDSQWESHHVLNDPWPTWKIYLVFC